MTQDETTGYEIIFEKLEVIGSEEAEIVLVTNEIRNEIDSTMAVVEQLKALSELQDINLQNNFYSGT